MSRSYKRLTKEAKNKLKAQVRSKRNNNYTKTPKSHEELDEE